MEHCRTDRVKSIRVGPFFEQHEAHDLILRRRLARRNKNGFSAKGNVVHIRTVR